MNCESKISPEFIDSIMKEFNLNNINDVISGFNDKLGLYIPYIANKHLRGYSTGEGSFVDRESNIEYKIKHFIKYYFTLNYGDINRVDVVKKSNEKGSFYCAFIHFNKWNFCETTIKLQCQLNSNIKSTFSLYHPNNVGWHWILLKQHNPEQYNNPEFLLNVIKKQEQQLKTMSSMIDNLTNQINNQELPRKKPKFYN